MTDTRSQLLNRKLDLLAALRQLERDRADGLVDEEAYSVARERYESEAAGILERLDTIEEADGAPPHRPARRFPLILGAAGGVAISAIVLFLLAAVHPRGLGESVTGNAAGAPATAGRPASPQLVAAERNARLHPRSADALIALGNAYLDGRDAVDADRSYRQAMRLDPTRPEAPTLHAMMLGYATRYADARSLLHSVERRHPAYSRAWLTDGLLSYDARDYRQAIAAWRRFLLLNPTGRVAADVRQLIDTAEKIERMKR